ncbi:hypothetical protein D3C75_805000 [compost metagenome]
MVELSVAAMAVTVTTPAGVAPVGILVMVVTHQLLLLLEAAELVVAEEAGVVLVS